MMRVAILNYRFFPLIDGPSIQTRLLAEELNNNGATVLVLTRRFSSKHPQFEKINGVNIRRLSCFGGYFWSHFPYGAKCLMSLCKYRNKIDIINTHGSIGMAMIGIACAKLLNKKVISTFDTSGLKIVGRVSSMKIPILSQLLKLVLKNLDAAIPVSNAIYEDLRAAQFPANKTYSISRGVDTDVFSPVSKEQKHLLRKRLKLPEKTLVIFTGRLVYTKGVDILLKALREIIRSTTDIHLVIIGEGYPKSISSEGYPKSLSSEGKLRKYIENHHLNQYVSFTGNVNNVHEYLQAGDIFAFPSRWEGIGGSILEAMSCCLPVVATNIGGIPDAVQDGVDGLLFPVDDHKALAKKILLLMNDVNLSKRLGKNARQKVIKAYSIEMVAEKYAELFQNITYRKVIYSNTPPPSMGEDKGGGAK